eukprot:TRINITY_DN3763_c0_g1_i3.p1 TRINITY_DN3763_c0_g1~~TRINITY_DN3763_c0_g1_i3.p1  ORF type:complete len:268 (-),score=87.50 TRINITY_DN3763_c0_g1_i3:79-882(-)
MAQKMETKGDSGVEVLKNEPYEKDGNTGQYTSKVYHLGSRIPAWIAALAPASALKLEEEAWNAFPDCKTQLGLPMLGDRFTFRIESKHFDNDRGTQENVFDLPEKELKSREVEMIDISDKSLIPPEEYDEKLDPALFSSEKTGRGPLAKGWEAAADPVMCAYKLVTVEFRYWGLQTRVQNYMMGMETKIFAKFHRQLFCWIDEWHGMSIEDIRALEERIAGELSLALADAPSKGSEEVKEVEGGEAPADSGAATSAQKPAEKKGWLW